MVGQISFFLCKRRSHFLALQVKNIDRRNDSGAAGIQIGNTVIATYIVDSYPLQSMSVITFYSVLLNLSAFVDPVSQL